MAKAGLPLPLAGRSTSVKMSELLEVSRATARKALAAAGGDVNLAISNVLTNILDKLQRRPLPLLLARLLLLPLRLPRPARARKS